jgi:hypothetical protein
MDSGSTSEENTRFVSDAAAPAEWSAPLPGLALLETAPVDPALYGVAPTAAYGYGVAPTVPARRNLAALLGLILAVPLWPVGLVLSAFGLFNAFTRRTGKVVAIIGLVLSTVTGGAIVALVVTATSTVNASTALDPGCASVETSLATDLSTLQTDAATLESNENSASSSSTSIDTVNGDLRKIQADLTIASSDATHAAVQTDLSAVNTQLQTVMTGLTGIQSHSTSSEGAAAAALTTLKSADANLDALCATY